MKRLGTYVTNKTGHAPAMKNQSLRGELEVSMICVGAIEWTRWKLSRVKECGGSKCKMREVLPGVHVIDAVCLLDRASGLGKCS